MALVALTQKEFEKIKPILTSEDLLLQYPNYNQSFVFQSDDPFKALSVVSSKTVKNYVNTAELKLFAIDWALKNFVIIYAEYTT